MLEFTQQFVHAHPVWGRVIISFKFMNSSIQQKSHKKKLRVLTPRPFLLQVPEMGVMVDVTFMQLNILE